MLNKTPTEQTIIRKNPAREALCGLILRCGLSTKGLGRHHRAVMKEELVLVFVSPLHPQLISDL